MTGKTRISGRIELELDTRLLMHFGTQTSIGVSCRSLASQRDLPGRSCTVIRNPEKRKDDSAARPSPEKLARTNYWLVVLVIANRALA
jgi:hypothetical protein